MKISKLSVTVGYSYRMIDPDPLDKRTTLPRPSNWPRRDASPGHTERGLAGIHASNPRTLNGSTGPQNS